MQDPVKCFAFINFEAYCKSSTFALEVEVNIQEIHHMYLHIISFDIPYPANYGGVIVIFNQIKALHEQGVKVILHCYQYGSRTPQTELE